MDQLENNELLLSDHWICVTKYMNRGYLQIGVFMFVVFLGIEYIKFEYCIDDYLSQ